MVCNPQITQIGFRVICGSIQLSAKALGRLCHGTYELPPVPLPLVGGSLVGASAVPASGLLVGAVLPPLPVPLTGGSEG